MQASSVLLSMLARGYGLQTIIDYAGQQFPGSIAAIVSTSGRLLACSSAEEISSPIIRSQIEQGFLNEATYELCRNGKLLSRFSTERHSFIVDDIQDQDLSWIMSAVRISDTVAAYFVAAGEKGGFREQDLPLADLFCQAFSIILSSENETGSSLHEGGVLINDLLQGVEYEEAALKSRIDMLQLTIPQVIQVVVVRGSHTATDKKSTQLVLNSISDSICRTFFKGCITNYFNNDVVIIAPSEDVKSIVATDEYTELEEALTLDDLFIGISNPFRNIRDVRMYYRQATEVLGITPPGLKKKRSRMYSDHAIDVLIQTSQIPVKELCHPVLYRMATAGSDLDKEYVDTLLHYVRCMKDAAQVSKAMHIHKNTLFYRISKVLDAAGLDLSRGEDVLMILITDRIFRTPSFIDPLTSVNV